MKHYFGQLKADDVEEGLYRALFFLNMGSVNQRRFQAIPEEEVANFIKKFKGAPKDLLSDTQMRHYFGQLKADDVDQTLYKALFVRNIESVNQRRFQAIPEEEVANFMKKFVGAPKDLLSDAQMRHYFGQLKVNDVDQTLYKALFVRNIESVNQRRFQALASSEAAALKAKFK